MRVAVLGAVEATLGEGLVDLGTRKQRALLAALVLCRDRPTTPDTLADLVWGDDPPPSVAATLQGYVARLRRALEPGRAPREAPSVLVTTEGGYRLVLPADAVDADRFATGVSRVHARVVAGEAPDAPDTLLGDLDAALALWRGTPYAELDDAPAAVAERARLEELRLVALEDRAVLALALGRHATTAAELEGLTAAHPLRERLWALRATALARAGRQADALDVLREVRTLLADELGLEPGPELQALQAAILRQDPAVVAPAPRRTTGGVGGDVTAIVTPPWPLVGRGAALASLTEALEQSRSGPTFAAVTGEPGIGKSRLCAELARAAQAVGVTVLVGRCSQDDGAPPLWPWASVLRGLGHDLPRGSEGDDGTGGARFQAWEEIARTLLDEAERRPLLVVLDDLHWADTSTLRVLGLVAELAERGGLMVVATWRPDPAPTGRLTEVAEALARRHATRVELSGLTAGEVADLVVAVADRAPTAAEADALRARTDGNPFFLVEYARLARERGDLPAMLAEEDPPAGVHDVLTRRLATLPDTSASTLRVAGVLGRSFDLGTLARVLDVDEETALGRLDPALASGLVRETGVDEFRFAHALVRDTAQAALPQSRRARVHARAAAVLEGPAGRESEVARHWLAAGPQHVAAAWRACLRAARAARRVFAYDEAVGLAAEALAVLPGDPGAGLRDEYGVLLELATAYQLSGNWVDLRPVVHRALVVADALGDLDLVAEAAALPISHALWQTSDHGEVDEVIVEVIRSALATLPATDSPQRCRLMLSLAGELYYGATTLEREALSDEAVAMARRLGDRELLLWALLAAPLCQWRKATARRRHELTAEAAALAAELGDARSESSALALQVAAAGDLGLVDTLPRLLQRAWALAEQEHHLYAELFLAGFEVPWLAMRGDFERADELLARMAVLDQRMSVLQSRDGLMGALAMRLMWGGREAELTALADEIAAIDNLPTVHVVAALLCRVGQVERAREHLRGHDLAEAGDWWYSPLAWALGAEAAAYVGDPGLGAEAYALLAPYAGQPVSAGSGATLGPVDAFLALGAVVAGEREVAARHGDDALALCEAWDLPLAAQWLVGLRERFGF